MSDTTARVTLELQDKNLTSGLRDGAKAAGELEAGARGAAGAVDELESGARRTEGTVEDLADSTRRAGASLDDMESQSGKLGSTSGRLAGALSLVSPAAGDVARNIADLADVAEVAAGVAKALGVSLASTLAVLGPVAVAVAAGAAAWHYFAAEEEAAAAKADAATAASEKAAQSWKELDDVRRAAADAEALATGRATEQDLRLRDALAKVVAAYGPRITAAQDLIEKDKAAIAAADAVWGAEKRNHDQLQSSADARRMAVADLEQHKAALAGLVEQQGKVLQQTTRGIVLAKDASGAAGNQAAAERDLAKAVAEHAAEEKARADARQEYFQGVFAALEQAAEARKLIASLYQETSPAFDAEESRWASQSAAIGKAIEQLREARVSEEELAWATDALALAEKRHIEALLGVAAATGEQFEKDLGGPPPPPSPDPNGQIAGTLSSLAGGASGMLGMLGMAGPVGGIVAAAISLVQAIGDGMLEQVQGLLDGLVETLADIGTLLLPFVSGVLTSFLPKLLETLPTIVSSILEELVPGLLQVVLDPSFWIRVATAIAHSILGIMSEVVEFLVRAAGEIWAVGVDLLEKGIKNLFSIEAWKDLIAAIGKGIADFFRGLLHPGGTDGSRRNPGNGLVANAWSDVSGWFAGAFDTGTDQVARTGLALVHQNERIIPASGASSQRSSVLMGGQDGGVHVHLGPGLVLGSAEQLARELARELGPSGRNILLPAGSVAF